MIVKLLTEHHLEFLSLKGGCRGWSESTVGKMSNCWKFHARLKYFTSFKQDKALFVLMLCAVSQSKDIHLVFFISCNKYHYSSYYVSNYYHDVLKCMVGIELRLICQV